MALNWCFNEPKADGRKQLIVAYPAIPKAFEAEADSLPPHASARLSKFTWFEGEYFEA